MIPTLFPIFSKEDSRALLYEPLIEEHDLLISVITVAELAQWTLLHRWQAKRIQRLKTYLNAQYDVIPVKMELCDSWAAVRMQCHLVGRPLAPHDAWIAATAIQYDLPIVTHNAKDFAPIANLQIITAA